jgi:hypothetical protein
LISFLEIIKSNGKSYRIALIASIAGVVASKFCKTMIVLSASKCLSKCVSKPFEFPA